MPECAVVCEWRNEVERLKKENDFLRAYVGNSDKACVYCGLGADEQGQCERGFPGCSRADDQLLCGGDFACRGPMEIARTLRWLGERLPVRLGVQLFSVANELEEQT